MNAIGIAAVFCSLFIAHTTMQAQSCCSAKGATASFAAFTSDKEFRAAHAEPLPFHMESEQGTLVTFSCDDGKEGKAYLLKAATKTDNTIFVIHEWWGLNDYVKQEAEKIQKAVGNVNVMALDLYDGKVATTRDSAAKYMSSASENRIRSIINGAILAAGPDAKICTIGWCFGGGWSMQSSLMLGKHARGCVIYYGMPESDENKLAGLDVPVLFIFAKKDGWINQGMVSAFEERMKRLHKTLTVKAYDADHAFANPSNPIYNKDAAEDAHKHAVEFMRQQFAK